MSIVNLPVSIGELWDKYTILLIKKEKIVNLEKIKHILNEIEYLSKIINDYPYENNKMFIDLKKVNSELWDIEDKIRIKEKKKEFNDEFIQLARQVYHKNDERANIKSRINLEYKSLIYEVKDYVIYK
jgi:hypothetical protein